MENVLEAGELSSGYTSKGDLLEFRLKLSTGSLIGREFLFKDSSYKVIGKISKGKGITTNKYYLIEFDDSVRLITCNIGYNIPNPYKPSICEVGYIGQGIFTKKKYPKEYNIWHGMLQRCYYEHESMNNATYKDCTVNERWHSFQNFCGDITKLENYDKWLEGRTQKKNNYELDKDLKIKNNKLYSISTCKFATHAENTASGARDLSWLHEYNKIGNVTGKIYKAVLLETGYEEFFTSQSKFSRDNNLTTQNVNACLAGRQKTHKGWTFFTIIG